VSTPAALHFASVPPVGYTVLRPGEQDFQPPSWRPAETERSIVELRLHAQLRHSQANVWRYQPGARGSRHREPVQEEVFCVLEGMLTMMLGDPAERFDLPPTSIVVVEPGTPVLLRNDSHADVLVFAYGAPSQAADYRQRCSRTSYSGRLRSSSEAERRPSHCREIQVSGTANGSRGSVGRYSGIGSARTRGSPRTITRPARRLDVFIVELFSTPRRKLDDLLPGKRRSRRS
jgi:quercetin dioxygenase-like cupin family protein